MPANSTHLQSHWPSNFKCLNPLFALWFQGDARVRVAIRPTFRPSGRSAPCSLAHPNKQKPIYSRSQSQS
eukprot:6191436-Pleurochrysis_carterae.AAC.1